MKRRADEEEDSWHHSYKDTAWIYIGSLSYKLSEGDVIAVFSQYGEIEDFALVRDEESGKSKGFAFLKYEDWRSTVLAVDNFNGSELLNRKLKVSHTRYERPKLKQDKEAELTLVDKAGLQKSGHAYKNRELETEHTLHDGHNVFS